MVEDTGSTHIQVGRLEHLTALDEAAAIRQRGERRTAVGSAGREPKVKRVFMTCSWSLSKGNSEKSTISTGGHEIRDREKRNDFEIKAIRNRPIPISLRNFNGIIVVHDGAVARAPAVDGVASVDVSNKLLSVLARAVEGLGGSSGRRRSCGVKANCRPGLRRRAMI